jgi:hypothetical protein
LEKAAVWSIAAMRAKPIRELFLDKRITNRGRAKIRKNPKFVVENY